MIIAKLQNLRDNDVERNPKLVELENKEVKLFDEFDP